MLGLNAEQIGTVLLAVSLLITGRLAQQKGKEIVSKAPPSDGSTVELRGAVISDRAADRLVQSMDAFTASATMLKSAIDRDVTAKEGLTKALERHGRDLSDNTEACEAMGGNIEKVGGQVGKLATELEIARAIRDRGGK